MQHWSSWVITSLGSFKDVIFRIDFGVMDDIGMVRIREVLWTSTTSCLEECQDSQ